MIRVCRDLEAGGISVLFDDQNNKPGFQFADADLIGIPLRLVLSPKTVADGEVEFKRRGERAGVRWPIEAIE